MSVFQISSISFKNEVVLTSSEEKEKCIHESLVLRPFLRLFCFNASCQYTPLLTLRSVVSLNVLWLGLLHHATPSYPITSHGNIIFDLRVFDLRPLFEAHNRS